MKHLRYCVLLIALLPLRSIAETADSTDLNHLNEMAKAPNLPPEQLDRIMSKLRPIAEHPNPSQEKLLLETYRTVATQYGANNHFKQAYQVFQSYLELKEHASLEEKNRALEDAQRSVADRRKKDDDAILSVQSKVGQLRTDNESLESHRVTFKRFFSFAVIGLSALFAAMLVSSGLKINSLRTSLAQSRKKILEMNRKATLGRMADGIRKSLKLSVMEMKRTIEELKSLFQKAGTSVDQEVQKQTDKVGKTLAELEQQIPN